MRLLTQNDTDIFLSGRLISVSLGFPPPFMRYDKIVVAARKCLNPSIDGNSRLFSLAKTRQCWGFVIKCLSSTVKAPFMSELEHLRDQLRSFAAERDWDQFHSPKNLASALSVEAAELLEHFQWLTEAQSQQPTPEVMKQVRAEAADVLLYLIRLSDKLGIDLIAAANEKLILNAQKYPVEKAFGTSKKYTEL